MGSFSEHDYRLMRTMTSVAQRISAGEADAYDVGLEAMGELTSVFIDAEHGPIAYQLWGEITDLQDAPDGPASAAACRAAAEQVSTEWLATDLSSPSTVAAFFVKWDPSNWR